MSKRDVLELILRGGSILAILWAVAQMGVLVPMFQLGDVFGMEELFRTASGSIFLFLTAVALWFGASTFARAVPDSDTHPRRQTDFRRLLYAGIGLFLCSRLCETSLDTLPL